MTAFVVNRGSCRQHCRFAVGDVQEILVANGLGHLAPSGNIQWIIRRAAWQGSSQQGHPRRVQGAQSLLELQQVRSLVFAVPKAQQPALCLVHLGRRVMDAKGRGIVADHFGRQSIGLNQMLAQLLLKADSLVLVFPQRTQQRPQPIICGLLETYAPARDLLQHHPVIYYPLFHSRQAMRASMQYVGQEQHRQLPIAQTLPVGMRSPDGVNDFLYTHLHQPMENQGNAVNPFNALFGHKPLLCGDALIIPPNKVSVTFSSRVGCKLDLL